MASTYWPITTNKLTPQRILLDNDLFANCRFPKGVNPTSQEKPVIDIYLNIRAEKAQKQLMPLAKRQWHQLFFMVSHRGFEPRTHCLKGNCSAD